MCKSITNALWGAAPAMFVVAMVLTPAPATAFSQALCTDLAKDCEHRCRRTQVDVGNNIQLCIDGCWGSHYWDCRYGPAPAESYPGGKPRRKIPGAGPIDTQPGLSIPPPKPRPKIPGADLLDNSPGLSPTGPSGTGTPGRAPAGPVLR
jgi:hypothetical protein